MPSGGEGDDGKDRWSGMRVAVIGCGGAGREHLRAYLGLGAAVEVVGVCDILAQRAQAAAETAGVSAYTDVTTLLRAARPEVVSVCTQEADHVEPSLAALAAGCHVLCEKPLAARVADAERLVEAAQPHGRTLGVDYNYRHMPPLRALRARIASGGLGDVVTAQISAHAFCYHHAMDLVRFLFGDVVEVAAWVADDPAHRRFPRPQEFIYIPSGSVGALLRTEGGATVSLTASRQRSLEDTLLDVEVVGTTGRAALRGMPVRDVRPRAVELFPPDPAAEADFSPRSADTPAFGLGDAFAASIAAFVAAITAGTRPPTDGHDGLAVLRIDQAVSQAHRIGGTVRLWK